MWYQVKKLNCERRVMCEINQGLKRLNFEPLAIVTSIALIQNSNVTSIEETQKLMKAARTGRIGKYPCSNIFSSECSTKEWNTLRDNAENLLWKQ